MDIFSTAALSGVIARLRPLPTFFLDNFFTQVSVSDKEEIYFDTIEGKPRITPFVHPLRQGKVIERTGYQTRSFKPAYLKDKRVFTPNKTIKRLPGEALLGSLTREQRLAALVAQDLDDASKMLTRRFEVMAAEAILHGTQTIIGDGFDQVVDFGRDPILNVVLTGDAKWDSPNNSDRGTQLEEFDAMLLDRAGVTTDMIVMDIKAWNFLREDPTFLKRLTAPNVAINPDVRVLPMKAVEGVSFKGYYGDYPIYVYKHTYIDPVDGVSKQLMPDNTVLLASQRVDGVRHFGAIEDLDAGMVPLEFFVKSWTEEDPSQRLILSQSAPLMVPYRINATLKVKVA